MNTSNMNYRIGPFTKETFSLPKWKQHTEKIYKLDSTNEEETIPDCQEILQLLLELNHCPDYNEYFGDASIKNYFFREFFINNAKYFIATKTFVNPEILELSNAILQQIVLFWVRAMHEDHPKLTETAKIIFDVDRAYYKINNQEDIVSGIIPSFLQEISDKQWEWIQSLKVGDKIDCIKVEPGHKKMCWSHAEITQVSETHLSLSYLYEKPTFNKMISKAVNAHEIAEYGTKCKDFEWRLNLKTGDELDACDTSNVWYNVTVLNERTNTIGEGKEFKELFIGYRVYSEEGDRYDQQGRKYLGWSSKYDEWLSATDPRLSKRDTMAKKLFMGSSSNTEDPVIDDSNDKIYLEEGKTVYAITRPAHCKSAFMVKMVNRFGEEGGFEKILQRISDTENWAPIEIVSLMVTLVGELHSVLHRDFALDYIVRLKEAVWNNLLKSPDGNIRNFTKERIDNILTAFDNLLKRVYSLPEKNEMIETMNLEICCICFDSNFLERKLQGLKSLLELLKLTKLGNAKYLNNDLLMEFIQKNQIFDKIFGIKGHTQLIQRSSEFLRFLIGEGTLSTAELETVWSSTRKGDAETRLATYKVLSDIALHFHTTHLNYLIEKISEIAPEEIVPEEIDLAYELNKQLPKSAGFAKKVLGFYWNIITDTNEQYTTEISELTLSKFSDILKSWDYKDDRLEFLHTALENIEKGNGVLASLRTMKKLIEHYPTSNSAVEKLTRKACIEHLCNDKNLLSILLEDLKSFKNNIRRKVGDNLKQVKEEDLNQLVQGRASYLTSIGDRLEFILFIFANNESSGSSKTALTYEHLSELWELMVNQAFLPGERDVVYKWIKETAESKSGFPMSSEDLLKFFQEKINNTQDYEGMTIEGFNCVKNLFLIINQKLEKISKIPTGSGVTAHGSSNNGYGVSYYSYSYNYEEAKNVQTDFDYKVNVLPEELEGIQSIWNFILSANNEDVVEKAVDFLNKLYLHVNEELEGKLVYMRSEYLAKCFKYLKEVLATKDQVDKKVYANNCLKCISLIRSIMDESEKKGIGNLKAHSGLVKGELLSFNVNNEVTTGSDVPKKVELKLYANTTVYELRVELARQFKATWDQIKLMRNAGSKEVKDSENGRTLGDVRIRNGETMTANKRPTPPIPQAALLLPDGNFNPEAKAIFVGWFEIFSENGKMSPDHCAGFIHSCTNDNCKGDDKRVKEVFATYDSDRDGFLTLDNFLEFYYLACKQRSSVVWTNLAAHHYRNDLKKVTDVEEEKVDSTTLARYIISQNEEYFHLILSLLDCGGAVANEAWRLLNRLPTSPEIFSNILLLKGIKESSQKNWDLILDSNSTYKLLYSLHVLEYLMEDEEAGTAEQPQIAKMAESKKNWRADFIAYGGFDHLIKIFDISSRKDPSTLNSFEKNVISFILKILKNYLTATFAASVPNIYRGLSFIQLLSSLDFISNYLNTAEEKEKKQEAALTTGAIEDAAKAQEQANKTEIKKKENLRVEETAEFKVLVERLRGDLGKQILQRLDLKVLVKTLSTLGFDLIRRSTELESEDRMIIEYSVSILTAILLFDKSTIKYFLNLDNKPENLQESDRYIVEGVFCSKSNNVRRFFTHAVYILCRYTKDYQDAVTAKHFINLLLNNLPASNEESRKECHQYFELLCKLIEETYTQKKEVQDDESFDFTSLIEKVVNRIKEHVSTEKRQNLFASDRILVGLLSLCEKILLVKPELRDVVGSSSGFDFVRELFQVGLFYTQEKESLFTDIIGDGDLNVYDKDYVKCKTRESRGIAYRLLITLCKGNESNLLILLENLKELMFSIIKQKTSQAWNYSPSADSRSYHGYAGIKNLGCICYMNAMLQQFFMTPAFRYAILASDDKKEPNMVNKDNKWMIDDNVLHQLQQMFGFLELTDRKDYNPFEFCFSFKDFTGMPVNVSEQQDTQEFLNTIFDRLENGMKKTPFRRILEGVYGGKTSNQIICHGCRNVRQKEEPFFNMSVEVRNMKTVYDSLDQFITGETIEDYYCEACNQKNSITKRTCLSYLPNVLIVHLKRIVFDLDTLMNQKINSRLEFPFDIDMEPFTAEGLEWREKSKEKGNKNKKKKQQKEGKDEEDEGEKDKEEEEEDGENPKEPEVKEGPYQVHPKDYYQYRLAGVVVHIGTAEMGHYYSYININRGPNNDPAQDKWLEFNDSLIKDFDVKSIEKECFGGASNDSSDDAWGGAWSRVGGGRENSKNAYILVYERVTKDPLKFVVDEQEDATYLNKVLNIDRALRENPEAVKIVKEEYEDMATKEKKEREIYECNYYMLQRFIPSNIYKKVWEDNHKFMFERHIYNDDFFKFFKDVCNSLNLPPMKETLENFIYTEHVNLSADTKNNIRTLISILSFLIFFVLSKSDDNNMILELSVILKNLLSLAPEAASTFFDNIVWRNLPSILELFINCPEKQVRHCTTQVVLQCINIMISYHGFTLDINRLKEKGADIDKLTPEELKNCQIEDSIVKFLQTLIGYLPTEVAKNWTKFAQYFEFFRDFSTSGDAQISFLYSQQFIAVLADLYLDKKSPLVGFAEKKHTIGNRYADPDFNALIQTIAHMVARAQINTKSGTLPNSSLGHQGYTLYPLSENDFAVLTCREFYEKTLKEKYHPQALGIIIQQLAFENDTFSFHIADILLRGLNKATYEDTKTYLEAIVYFLSIADFVQPKRAEWVLGFPQPTVTTALNSLDSFGIYGNLNIDDSVVSYETPLNIEGSHSLINYMLQHRKRLENNTLLCLNKLLTLVDISPPIFEYLLYLPPPSYNYAKFIDWIMPFLDYYFGETKKYSYTTYHKEELAQATLQLWKTVEAKYDARIAASNANKEEGTEKSEVIPGFFKTYIVGKTKKEEEIDRQLLSQPEDPEEVVLVQSEVTCYITESKPTGHGNLAIPARLMHEGRFKNEDSRVGTAEEFFIKPRGNMGPGSASKENKITVDTNRARNDEEAALVGIPDDNSFHADYDQYLNVPSNGAVQDGSDTEHDYLGNNEGDIDSGRGEAGKSPETAVSQELIGEKHDDEMMDDEGKGIIQEIKTTKEEEEGEVQQQHQQHQEREIIEGEGMESSEATMVRRFILYNNSALPVSCQLFVYAKNNNFLNFRVPSSIIYANVRAKSSACILSLMKIFPEMPWGEYEVKCVYQAMEQAPVSARSGDDSGKKRNNGNDSNSGWQIHGPQREDADDFHAYYY